MDDVVLLRFPGIAEARQALAELRRLHDADQIDLGAAALVGRRDDGRSFALEQLPDHPTCAPADGLPRLLQGPFGIVVGRAPDALVGSLVDVADPTRSEQLVRGFGDAVPPGSIVTVALLSEKTPGAVDGLACGMGAAVTRKSRDDVEHCIAGAEERRRRTIGERLRGVKDALVARG